MLKSSDKPPRLPNDCHVVFDPIVRVAMLPMEERLDAWRARKSTWKPGPLSDEIWDGDLLAFREVELTPEEFKILQKRRINKRTSLPKSLQKLFSAASEKLVLKNGRFGGVDIVSARARLSEDFDEFERDENTTNTLESESKGIISLERQSSSTSLPKPPPVKITYHNFDISGAPPVNGYHSEARNLRTTRFIPTPPSGKSPTELLIEQQNEGEIPLSPMENQNIRLDENEGWKIGNLLYRPKHKTSSIGRKIGYPILGLILIHYTIFKFTIRRIVFIFFLFIVFTIVITIDNESRKKKKEG